MSTALAVLDIVMGLLAVITAFLFLWDVRLRFLRVLGMIMASVAGIAFVGGPIVPLVLGFGY